MVNYTLFNKHMNSLDIEIENLVIMKTNVTSSLTHTLFIFYSFLIANKDTSYPNRKKNRIQKSRSLSAHLLGMFTELNMSMTERRKKDLLSWQESHSQESH